MPRKQGSMVFPAGQFQDNQPFLHSGIGLLRVCSKTSGWRLQNFLWRNLRVLRTSLLSPPVCQTSQAMISLTASAENRALPLLAAGVCQQVWTFFGLYLYYFSHMATYFLCAIIWSFYCACISVSKFPPFMRTQSYWLGFTISTWLPL